MTSRANRPFFISMMSLTLLAGPPRLTSAQVRGIPDWTADRSPVAVIALYNGTYEAGDRWGLQECWRRGSSLPADVCAGKGGVAWLVSELERRRQLGYRRFMLSLPAGRADGLPSGQGWPSAQWHVLDTAGIQTLPGSKSVRRDLRTLLTPWLAQHRDVQLLIYQGLRFNPTLPKPWKDRDMTGSIAPNLSLPIDRKIVQENTLHWLELTPQERLPSTSWPWTTTPQIGFAFDNTGIESTRKALVAVLEDTTLFGNGVQVFVSGEAIPHVRNPSLPPPEADMDHASIFRAPWFGLMKFHQLLDPLRTWDPPGGTHLGFAVHNREYCVSDREIWCVPGQELTDEQIHEAIRSAHERGFVIFHYGWVHDDFILKLVGVAP